MTGAGPLPAPLTPYQSQYIAWLLSRRMNADSPDMLATTLVDAQVDLNPHQEQQLIRSNSVRDVFIVQWALL